MAAITIVGLGAVLSLTMWDNLVTMINRLMEYISAQYSMFIRKYNFRHIKHDTTHKTQSSDMPSNTNNGQWISESSTLLKRTVTDLQTPSFLEKTASLQRQPASTVSRHAAGYSKTPSIPQDERLAVQRGRVVTEEIKLLQLIEHQ